MKLLRLFATVLLALIGCAPFARAAEKPKVRAITAFVRIDRAGCERQIQETLAFLRSAKAAFEKSGYEVQTIRITTQPFPEIIRGLEHAEALAFFQKLDKLAEQESFDASIGPAMRSDADDPRQAHVLGEIIRSTNILNGSVIVAGEDGVYWNAVHAAAELVKFLSEQTPRSQGNFRFAATSLLSENAPFFPGSYHSGTGQEFAIALQSANVVAEVLQQHHTPAAARDALVTFLGQHALEIEKTAQRVARDSAWKFMGIDLSPAPLKDVSIGAALESFTGAPLGAGGTLTAAALVTEALRSIPVKRIGYSGLMLPVLEDSRIAARWSEGALTVDELLAYSAVCGTGLDTIPLPGEISVVRLARMIGDMATLSVKLRKPLSARLMPVAGKKAGDRTEFDDPFIVNVVLRPLR